MSFPSRLGTALVLAIAALAVLALAGCGETLLDAHSSESKLKEEMEKSSNKKVSAVECPSNVEVVAGKTFECTIKLADGKEETAVLKIRDKNADVDVLSVTPKK